MRSEELTLKLRNLPDSPGVYLFKNSHNKIIYIGKARRLKNRVRTYFQASGHPDPKTERMISQVTDFELVVTDNELESLILEANLVREHKPRYNVLLKDDKHFPYIKVTTGEPFPQVLVVRRLERDNATYFGPYTSSKGMRRTLALLTRLFKIRTCDLVIPHPDGKPYKVCLDYSIQRCGGPCEGYQSQEEYRKLVDAVIMVLKGKSKSLVDQLRKRMQAASEQMEYEKAAELRDQIEAIGSMMIRQNADVGEVVDRDIVAIARESSDAVAVVMQIREGMLIGRQDFQLTTDKEENDEAVLETFLTQYYNHQPNLPDELFVPYDLPKLQLVARWLRKMKGSKVKMLTPRIGGKVKLVGLASKNARLLLDELLIQRRQQSERTSKMVVSLRDELKLGTSLRTMVCFDISNTGKTDFVGSCVYFENGKPKKKEYRHFKIKGETRQDDFRMMREIIGRYFYRIKEEGKRPPDLVVVDGGKGQLSSAKAELVSLGMTDQPIISLAKRMEEVFLPGLSDPVTISKASPALFLLKRIRDEAHRFAITFNRKVRKKRTIASALDGIPGVGQVKKASLLKAFGSVKQVREKTAAELTAVKGITPKLAEAIISTLRKK
jgi:excinuclease ABC subunit C